MSVLLPIIQQLRGATTHAERKVFLCRCPCGILRRYEMVIAPCLQQADFPEGIAYLRLLNAADDMVRDDDGFLPVKAAIALGNALIDMERAIAREQSQAVVPAHTLSPTDS